MDKIFGPPMIPFICKSEDNGVTLVGLKCRQCGAEYQSADIVLDSQMFDEATLHTCAVTVRKSTLVTAPENGQQVERLFG